jgi:hypothetical protein
MIRRNSDQPAGAAKEEHRTRDRRFRGNGVDGKNLLCAEENDSRETISESFRSAKTTNQQPVETKTMTTKYIEFASPKDLAAAPGSPWDRPRSPSYADLVLKPEYRDRIHRFQVGTTTARVLPPLAGSTRNWLLGCQVIKHSGGQHLHGRTLNPDHRSVFDLAYRWCRRHQPESLYSKQNPQGFRLLADPVSVFGLLVEVPDSRAVVARWVVAGA